MLRFILALAVVFSVVFISTPEQASAACSGDITSFYLSGGYYRAAGWANCSGKLCVLGSGSATCDYSSPFSAADNAGVCLTNSTSPVYASAWLVSGGSTVDAVSVRKC
jgi:hypothetical protein